MMLDHFPNYLERLVARTLHPELTLQPPTSPIWEAAAPTFVVLDDETLPPKSKEQERVPEAPPRQVESPSIATARVEETLPKPMSPGPVKAQPTQEQRSTLPPNGPVLAAKPNHHVALSIRELREVEAKERIVETVTQVPQPQATIPAPEHLDRVLPLELRAMSVVYPDLRPHPQLTISTRRHAPSPAVPPTTIHVSIGRLEIRNGQREQRPSSTTPPSRNESLEKYLDRRRGRSAT